MSDPTPSNPGPPAQPRLERQEIEGRVLIKGIQRGMIFWANVLPIEAKDHEQNHDVPSPWLIVSVKRIHAQKLVQAVPLTSKLHKEQLAGEDFRVHRIRLNPTHLTHYHLADGEKPLNDGDQLVLTEQLRVMAHRRLVGNPIAKVTIEGLTYVEAGLRYVLHLPV